MRKITLSLVLILICAFSMKMNAQVTIGDDTDPASFSLLELTTSKQDGGLRLPQLSTSERNSLNDALKANIAQSIGLVIYNKDTKCQEYWNGNKWISLCLGSADIMIVRAATGDPLGPDDPTATDAIFPAIGDTWGPYNIKETYPCEEVDPAYDIMVIAGSENMAIVKSTDGTGNFYLEMYGNSNTIRSKTAIIRVTNNCSKEYKDFVLKQSGAECPGSTENAFTLSPYTTQTLCNEGSVYVNVVVPGNPATQVDYIWTLNDVIVHTGMNYEITRPGKYKVYAGLAGCEIVPSQEINIVAAGAEVVAPGQPTIFASNNGIICGTSGKVVISAYNIPSDANVLWYHNGVFAGETTSGSGHNYIAQGKADSGYWFAIIQQGSCTSKSSNQVYLLDQTENSGGATRSVSASVNGIDMNTPDLIKVCKGGTLTLKVDETVGFGPEAIYEWFANGASIYKGTSPETYYVAQNVEALILEVQVTDNSGLCPISIVTKSLTTINDTPHRPVINNGIASTLICGTSIVDLKPSVFEPNMRYEWFKDDVLYRSYTAGQVDASVLAVTTPGVYKVRCMNAVGCWSAVSEPIEVIQSNELGIRWSIEPEAEVIFNESPTYAVITAPLADSYTWSAVPAEAVQIIPIGDHSSAMVKFLEQPNELDITITVTATNACGPKSVSKTVHAIPGCNPITQFSISGPSKMAHNTSQLISLESDGDYDGKTVTWYVDGTEAGTTFVTESNRGSYAFTATQIKTYTITAVISNACTSNKASSTEVKIDVEPNLPDYSYDARGFYKISGTICFDVNRSGTGQLCGLTGKRQNTFATAAGKTFTYSFFSADGSALPSDLAFTVDDPQNIIKSYTRDGSRLHVTFIDNIETRASGLNSHTNGLQAYVYAYYTGGGVYYKMRRTLTVKDCVCGAVVNGSTHNVNVTGLIVNSYNLGADQSIDPFDQDLTLPERQSLNGDYYQWGRNIVVGDVNGKNNQFRAGALNNDNVTTWPTGSDPCQSLGGGWRLPSKFEASVIGKNLGSARGSWNSSSSSNFTAGRPDATLGVWFPATGFLNGSSNADGDPGVGPAYTVQYSGNANGAIIGRALRTEIFTSNTTMLDRQDGTVGGHWFPAYTIIRQSSVSDTETSKRYARVVRCVK